MTRLLLATLAISMLVACEPDAPATSPEAGETSGAQTNSGTPDTPSTPTRVEATHDAQTPPCARPDEADELAECQRKCDARDLVACVGLGRARVLALDASLDTKGPLERACNGGLAEGCTALGDVLVVEDAPKAVAAWKKACDGGHSIGCQRAGFELEMGKTVAMDRAAATTLYERSCTLGLTLGCVSHGYALRAGYTGEPDAPAALERFSKACEARDLMGCTFEGILRYEGAEGVPQDKEAASKLLEKGCSVDARACSFLAKYRFEKGEKASASLAAVDACTRGGAPMCVEHVPEVTKACDEEDATACYALASLLDLGVPLKDPRRPAVNTRRNAALERACTFGKGPACGDLAEFTAKGYYGIEPDARRARKLYKRGCDLKHAPSCSALKPKKSK